MVLQVAKNVQARVDTGYMATAMGGRCMAARDPDCWWESHMTSLQLMSVKRVTLTP